MISNKSAPAIIILIIHGAPVSQPIIQGAPASQLMTQGAPVSPTHKQILLFSGSLVQVRLRFSSLHLKRAQPSNDK